MEIDSGIKLGVTSDQAARMKELERENRELKRANEILRKASTGVINHFPEKNTR